MNACGACTGSSRAPWRRWRRHPRPASESSSARLTAGLLEASPPPWRWAVALGLGALATGLAMKLGPALVRQ